MFYSEDYIFELGKKTGFINANVEKVIRLLDVLKFIDGELDPSHSKLVLKGGTAINLMYTNLARLSVDLDFDFIGALNKEETDRERGIIISALDSHMLKEGYSISPNSRGSVILTSRIYAYENAFGNRDNIKVEINFIDRIHIFPMIRQSVKYFDIETMIATPFEEELFSMKICALIDRSKPRDLFDTEQLKKQMCLFDHDRLRKLIVFYLSLDGIFEINESSFDGIKSITDDSVKKELIPVLAKGNRFDLEKAKVDVLSFLKEMLILNDTEQKYLIEFANGNFDPWLLFDDHYAEIAAKHPMAKWRVTNKAKNNQVN